MPAFSYKFTSDAAQQLWTTSDGYGARSTSLKYFDTNIAIYNVKNSVEPGRIIALTPFKLDVFESALRLCKDLRTELAAKQQANADRLASIMQTIRAIFAGYRGSVLAELTSPTLTDIEKELKLGESYSEESGLEGKLKNKAELEKATSEEGIKLLKGEASALKALYKEIHPILEASQKLIEIDPVSQSRLLKTKEDEQKVLAKALVPSGSTLDKLMALIRPANEICSLHSPETAGCPLCKQDLQDRELVLFKQYATLLTNELDTTIIELRGLISLAEKNHKVIADCLPSNWAKNSILDMALIDAIKSADNAIQSQFMLGAKIDQASKDSSSALRELADDLLKQLQEKEKLIEQAGRDREVLLEQLSEISIECRSLLYAKQIAENADLVKEAHRRVVDASFWDEALPEFTTMLRKLTATAKRAHRELVVDDFKNRLNAEYITLAEKDMSAFGVQLKDVGGDGAVAVDHHIAGKRIEAVLSEGEQRIHALALFFAELETCTQQVIIIFDDPISSFDYNHIANYCNRLRDFLRNHPNRQIIVLTHNWEFFVQFQTTINAARPALNQHMAVYVLESCVALDEYGEDVEALKSEINAILSVTGEPTKAQKEVLAGKMRRLIESVVNTHVFNKQRHQFKQKSQQVSAFDDFTRVVPLLPAEAQSLRDLFAKLSITEHDDPRNAYVNTDKAMFQTRYNAIKLIEAAIVGRK